MAEIIHGWEFHNLYPSPNVVKMKTENG